MHNHTHTALAGPPEQWHHKAPLHSLFLRCCVALNNITALGRHVCVFVSEKRDDNRRLLKGNFSPKTIVLSSFTNLCDFISSVNTKHMLRMISVHALESVGFRTNTGPHWLSLYGHYSEDLFCVQQKNSYTDLEGHETIPLCSVQLKACHLLLQFTLNCMQHRSSVLFIQQ